MSDEQQQPEVATKEAHPKRARKKTKSGFFPKLSLGRVLLLGVFAVCIAAFLYLGYSLVMAPFRDELRGSEANALGDFPAAGAEEDVGETTAMFSLEDETAQLAIQPWARYPETVQTSPAIADDRLRIVDRRYRLEDTLNVCAGNILAPIAGTGVMEHLDAQFVHQGMITDLTALAEAATAEGVTLYVRTTCRDFARQKTSYDYWFSQDGFMADEYVYRPGHSPTHLGTVIQFTAPEVNFFDEPTGFTNEFTSTNVYDFLNRRGVEFGFVQQYPQGAECQTGVAGASWDWRWLGQNNAQAFSVAKAANPNLSLNEWLYEQNGLEFQPYC